MCKSTWFFVIDGGVVDNSLLSVVSVGRDDALLLVVTDDGRDGLRTWGRWAFVEVQTCGMENDVDSWGCAELVELFAEPSEALCLLVSAKTWAKGALSELTRLSNCPDEVDFWLRKIYI